ncbi:DHH phosphoesterase [Hypoxylon sp. FL1284]|nr:DHH phosphoesterase [Hypoxylon sp. FL1284]
MAPQKTLQAFLATARAALTAPPSKRPSPLHFVVGNESADLDSLCSALFLAYFRSQQGVKQLHVPLCHLPREDLALRPEFESVLRRAGAAPDDVLTLTELLPAAHDDAARWLLVDHNVPAGALAGRGRGYDDPGCLVGCVDHHVDEGRVPADADPRVIETAGSCMSLVVELCGDAWGGGKGAEQEGTLGDVEINAQLAYLALAPILVDTANLGDPNKTTAHDSRAVAAAEARIRKAAGGGAYDRDRFFAEVMALKEDISRMSVYDVLRKDYKEWDIATQPGDGGSQKTLTLGTSSAPRPFADLVRKAGDAEALVTELARFAERKRLDVLAVLTAFRDDDNFARELLVWARAADAPAVADAVRRFAAREAADDRLGLAVWGGGKLDEGGDGDASWRRCWTQARVEHSRKQIAPLLREVLEGVGGGGE